jgi:hypothetical protein
LDPLDLHDALPIYIATGANVQVHYKAEGKDHVATSVMLATTPAKK